MAAHRASAGATATPRYYRIPNVEAFNIDYPPTTFFELPTIGDMAAILDEAITEPEPLT